jgi:hypothetical protein
MRSICPGIPPLSANELQPDSDLGARLVTRDVGELGLPEIEAALAAGADCAERALGAGLIEGAALCLQGEIVTVGLCAIAMPRSQSPLAKAARGTMDVMHV